MTTRIKTKSAAAATLTSESAAKRRAKERAQGPQVIAAMRDGRCMRVSLEFFVDIEQYQEIVEELKQSLNPCIGVVFVTGFDLMAGDVDRNTNMLRGTAKDLTLD